MSAPRQAPKVTPFAEPIWHNRPVDAYYNDSHVRLRDCVRAYVTEKITPNCAEWEEQGFVPDKVLLEHSLRGYTAVTVNPAAIAPYMGNIRLPADIKPEEWDAFHDLICIDEIARCGYLGVIWALGCGDAIGLPPVINFGTDFQKRQFLPQVIQGRARFCLAVTEPDGEEANTKDGVAGSDVANITTTAERKGNVYIVNGAKKWITNGIWASHCTAAVRTGGPGKNGISALIIPLTSKGVTRRKILNSGVAASGSTYIEFDDVEVPITNLLGNENEGFKIIMSNFNHERIWLACTSLRMARVCLQDAYTYALSRQTFGTALINHQAIRSKFSLLGSSILPAHAFMESIVSLSNAASGYSNRSKHDVSVLAEQARIGGLVALLKVVAARALEQSVREAQQIMGGLGYSRTGKGARIEQISRDMRVMVVGGGSEEILSELAFAQEGKDLEAISQKTRSML